MRRGGGGVNGTDALDTINAAATAIASAENRVTQSTSQKRRWRSWLSHYWCFGSQKTKRMGRAVLVPEPSTTSADAPATNHPPQQPPSIVLPFVAPPSSPASFLPSEPPSATQSPTGLLSLTSVSANMYSPGGPHSIFAIGPYAHETQLVSPPVFSTFTTEPSTAPYTPPPDSVLLTTPSSPEVPFAILEPNLQNCGPGQRYPFTQYEFQSYHLQPGSPVSHLISPCSGISGSGTSSPFRDQEFAARHPFFLALQNGDSPQLLDLDKIVRREWESSSQVSGSVTPDAAGPRYCIDGLLVRQNSDVAPLRSGPRNDEAVVDHRVSFEIPGEQVIRCVEKKPLAFAKVVPESVENVDPAGEEKQSKVTTDETSISTSEERHQKVRTITLGSTKEFNFDNIEGGDPDEHSIGSSEWWVNEKVVAGEEGGPSNWSFFPMAQTGVS